MRPIIIACGLLAVWTLTTAGSCATTRPPQVVTQIVKVPVPVRCDAKPAPRPDYPDTPALLKSAPTDRLLQLLYAGRKVRDGYINELEAANSGCSKP